MAWLPHGRGVRLFVEGAAADHVGAGSSAAAVLPPPPPTGSLRALSVKQPWASGIVDGYKTVENRTWAPYKSCPLPRWFWLHAGGETATADHVNMAFHHVNIAVHVDMAKTHVNLPGHVGIAQAVLSWVPRLWPLQRLCRAKSDFLCEYRDKVI
eukprot:277421-Prymnesium_polylepis.1